MNTNAEECVFCSIINGTVPSDIVEHFENGIVIRDIHPQAPVHLLVIPSRHIHDYSGMTDKEIMAVMDMLRTLIQRYFVVRYRIENNGGGRQIVNHVHFHLIGFPGSASDKIS